MTGALADFSRHFDDPTALRCLVSEHIRRDPSRIASQSRETTTHYKWLLACDRDVGAKLWLHEFKPAHMRRSGYASTVHNHRYPFTAVALSGGYTNKRCRVAFERETLRVDGLDIVRREDFFEGVTYAMEPDEFHCVEDIEDGTQSLILELPATRPVSFSLDPRSDRMTEHVPLESRVWDLLRQADRQ